MGDKGGVCGLRMRNEGGGLGSELRGDEEMRVHGGGDKCGRWRHLGDGGGGWWGVSWPGTG